MRPLNRREMIGAFAGAAVIGPVASAGQEFVVSADGGDATASVERAIAKCLKAGGGTVHLPGGAYVLSKRLDVELPAGVPLALRGDGPGLSRLTWANADGGLHIRFKPEGGFDGNKGAILVEGLSLLTTHPSGGHAIRLVCDGGSSPAPKKLLRDLILAGWSTGVDCVDCTFTTLDGIDFQGAGSTGVAVRFSGDHDPVDNYVTRLRVLGARDGVEVTGACEGIYLTQSTMLAVERGVHWHTAKGEPLLSMSGCHVSATRDCVLGHNLIQSLITNNLFYQSPNSGDAETEWSGVRLTADEPSIYDLLQVTHNTIHAFPGPAKSRRGIVIANRLGGIVQGNVVQGADVGIELGEGSGEMKVLDNIVRQFKTADVLDRGKDNVVRAI